MPMMRSFVPRRLQPWLYVFMAVTFQLSGGLYMGTLSHMMGETTLMREDLQMCLYANLAGMAIYFPLLFRMKFRFTNKTLLAAAALTVLACNALVTCTTFLPLLWALCFIEGIGKIQGTFECMSTIQLWMTPRRDFTVFFPLHIIILGSMQVSDLLSAWLAYYFHWTGMQWFMCGVMLIDLFVLTCCTRHFRIVKKFPLLGIDWLGGLLWALLLLEIAYSVLRRLLRLVQQPRHAPDDTHHFRHAAPLSGTYVPHPASVLRTPNVGPTGICSPYCSSLRWSKCCWPRNTCSRKCFAAK